MINFPLLSRQETRMRTWSEPEAIVIASLADAELGAGGANKDFKKKPDPKSI